MSRPLSSVTIAALASVITMTAFVLWTGNVRMQAAPACFGPACASDSVASEPYRSLGLIDL